MELANYPERLSVIVEAYAPSYQDQVTSLLEKVIAYRRELESVGDLLHFANQVPGIDVGWLSNFGLNDPTPMHMRKETISTIAEFLEAYRRDHSHK